MANIEEIDEDAGFSGAQEAIKGCLENAAEAVLNEQEWDEKKVPGWVNEICERTMENLLKLNLPYKYLITCMVHQKYQQAFGTASSVIWENNVDGTETVHWPNLRSKDKATMTVMSTTTVFCVRF